MKLFFREYGQGPNLVILHGLYGSSDNWVSIARSLSSRFRVILPDLRNHGRSPHNEIHNYISMSDDLYELVNLLGLQKFHLSGHSMGGKAALFFASRWPEMIEGLIIIDISPFKSIIRDNPINQMHNNILKVMTGPGIENIKSREEAAELFSGTVESKNVRNFLLKNLERIKGGGFKWKFNPASLEHNLDKILDGLPRPTKESDIIRGFPVLFIKGGDSDFIPDEDTDDIIRLFPASEILVIPGASHWLHAENPDILIAKIEEFAFE
jgi:pimeloyl-ACP methyl ester carboxylesterase